MRFGAATTRVTRWSRQHDRGYKLNLVPSGIVREDVACFIGNGVVLTPPPAVRDPHPRSRRHQVRDRLRDEPGCPLILSLPRRASTVPREAKKNDKIGTTGKGIGPTYEGQRSPAARGLRPLRPRALRRCRANLEYHNFVLTRHLGAEPVDFQTVFDQAMADADELLPMVADVRRALRDQQVGRLLPFEGAQGTLLDIDHGTLSLRPSSNCVAGQAGRLRASARSPSALRPRHHQGLLHPRRRRSLPTELDIETQERPANRCRPVGREFGTVTGRNAAAAGWTSPRLKRSIIINGVTGLCITKPRRARRSSAQAVYWLHARRQAHRPPAHGLGRGHAPRAHLRDHERLSGTTFRCAELGRPAAGGAPYLHRIEEICEIPSMSFRPARA